MSLDEGQNAYGEGYDISTLPVIDDENDEDFSPRQSSSRPGHKRKTRSNPVDDDEGEVDVDDLIGRFRSRVPNFSSSDEDEENADDESETARRKTKRKGVYYEGSSSDEPDFDEDDLIETVSKPKKSAEPKPKSKGKQKAEPPMVNLAAYDEAQVDRTSWLLSNVPEWSPYRPQLGDMVYYIRSGHAAFSEKVADILTVSVDQDLPNVLLAKVLDIKYSLIPILVCDVTLAIYPFLDPQQEDERKLSTMSIRWFDFPGMPDVLILDVFFNASREKSWVVGDKVVVRYGADEEPGTVLEVTDSDDPWAKYTVKLTQLNQTDQFCCWELRNPDETFANLPSIDRKCIFI